MDKLPPYIRESLKHIPWASEILNIGRKYGIHVDDMGTLQLETMMVLVGIVHPNEYPKALEHELHIPPDTIAGIVHDVNEKILKTIRQELISFIEQKNNETEQIFEKTGIELDPEGTPTVQREIPTSTTFAPMEKDILEHSGVDVEENTGPAYVREVGIGERDIENETVNRNSTLEGIEHPSLIQAKRSATTVSGMEKSRFEGNLPTVPKPPQTPQPPQRKSDPYREPLS